MKPVPQTNRMKDKYTVDKCALTAKLMREGESKVEGEDENDEDEMSEEEEKKGGAKGKKATAKEVKQNNAGKQAK